ncbi:MAG: M23 family metallopeptidase, partial [Chloroflexota bacterium]
GTVISAAHSGFVTIPPFSNCSLYSVNITSDDGRYQTRYLHLGPDVTSAQYVQAGDYIGRVAGVVTRCMKGPHLHLTVLFDANDDGHFVVDERVDPYGWQPFGQTDPWTTTFQDRLGDWHTGTASEWLWSFSPPAHLQVQPEQPARLTTSDGVGLYVPAGAVERTTSLAYVIAPQPTGSPDGPAVGLDTKLYPTLPAGPTFTLTASAGPNQPLAALNRPASLIIDYERARTATVAEDSLSLYWWDRVKGHWRPLPTTLDRQEQVAQAELSQLGLFSLRGRPLQPAPEITAVQWANEDRPDTLIINGRHFAPAPLINLEFNQLEVISATPTSILARIPAWATAGAYGLRLQNPDGQTAFWSPIYYRP